MACAGTSKEQPAPSGVTEIHAEKEGDVVGWRIHLSQDAPIIAALGSGAEKAGCQVHKPDDQRVLAQCKDGAVAVIQEGRRVLIGCQDVGLEGCRSIFQRILEKTPIKP